MSFLTLLLSRFFHEENYYDHKKTNVTLSNTRIYLGGKHPLVVFNCCCSFKSMEAFIQQKFSRVLDKENIVLGHTFHDLTFRRRIDSQKLKQK